MLHNGAACGQNSAVSRRRQHLLKWLKQGDAIVPPPLGWAEFVAKGAGTSVSRNSTAGFYHHLENLVESGFKNIHSIDALDALGKALKYVGRPDLLEKTGTQLQLVLREFKNLKPGNLLSKGAKSQLRGNIRGALDRARAAGGGARLDRQDVLAEIGRMKYVFRGAEAGNLRTQMRNIIRECLPDELKDVADIVTRLGADSMLVFQGKTWPF